MFINESRKNVEVCWKISCLAGEEPSHALGVRVLPRLPGRFRRSDSLPPPLRVSEGDQLEPQLSIDAVRKRTHKGGILTFQKSGSTVNGVVC